MNWSFSSLALVGVLCGYLSTSNLACSFCNCPDLVLEVDSGAYEVDSISQDGEAEFPEMNDARVTIDAEGETVVIEYSDAEGERVRVGLSADGIAPGFGGAQ